MSDVRLFGAIVPLPLLVTDQTPSYVLNCGGKASF